MADWIGLWVCAMRDRHAAAGGSVAHKHKVTSRDAPIVELALTPAYRC